MCWENTFAILFSFEILETFNRKEEFADMFKAGFLFLAKFDAVMHIPKS